MASLESYFTNFRCLFDIVSFVYLCFFIKNNKRRQAFLMLGGVCYFFTEQILLLLFLKISVKNLYRLLKVSYQDKEKWRQSKGHFYPCCEP